MPHGAVRARHADSSPVPPCHPSQSRELAEWVINLVTQLSLFHLNIMYPSIVSPTVLSLGCCEN